MAVNRDSWASDKHRAHRDRIRNDLVPHRVTSQQYLQDAVYGKPFVADYYTGSYQRTIDRTGHLWGLLKNGTVKNTGSGIWFDFGGPFWSEKVEARILSPELGGRWPPKVNEKPSNFQVYSGIQLPHVECHGAFGGLQESISKPEFAGNVGASLSEMLGWGTTGIARALPSVPAVSLFQILGELREGLPKIPGSSALARTGFNPGDEFLNYVFGIAPSAADAVDLIDVGLHYEELSSRLKHLSKTFRRSRTVYEDDTFTVESSGMGKWYTYPQPQFGGPGVKSVRTRRRVWVESIFSHSSAGVATGILMQQLRDFVRVLGVEPTPANIWELVPYSWLVDWFSNAGELFTNLSYGGRDGVRLLQSYVMCETHVTKTWQLTAPVFGTPTQLFAETDVVVKQRCKASPYIFAPSFNELSLTQKAVLAALGVSRIHLG